MTKKQTKEETAIAKLDELRSEHSLAAFSGMSDTYRAVALASAAQEFKEALEPCLHKFLPLANTAIGFKTDKQYQPQVLLEVMTEAFMRGLNVLGNQFNVISSRLYVTKEGFAYLVPRLRGVSELEYQVGQPKEIRKVGDKEVGAYMPFSASYKLNGKAQVFDVEVYCRSFAGPSAMDALDGKATRKGLAKLHERIVGFAMPEGELDDSEIVQVEAEVLDAKGQSIGDRMAGKLADAADDLEDAATEEEIEEAGILFDE